MDLLQLKATLLTLSLVLSALQVQNSTSTVPQNVPVVAQNSPQSVVSTDFEVLLPLKVSRVASVPRNEYKDCVERAKTLYVGSNREIRNFYQNQAIQKCWNDTFLSILKTREK